MQDFVDSLVSGNLDAFKYFVWEGPFVDRLCDIYSRGIVEGAEDLYTNYQETLYAQLNTYKAKEQMCLVALSCYTGLVGLGDKANPRTKLYLVQLLYSYLPVASILLQQLLKEQFAAPDPGSLRAALDSFQRCRFGASDQLR